MATSFSPSPSYKVTYHHHHAASYPATSPNGNIIYPEHKQSAIGGYTSIYIPSHIGGHSKSEYRDVGIGKPCINPDRSSSIISSFKRAMSWTNLRCCR